jgi:hypothetical protein
VDRCSWINKAGTVAGIGIGVVIGGGVGLEAGLEKEGGEFAADQWSHWIPDRYKSVPDWIRDSELNGRYMSRIDHMLNDPKAYNFMPKNLKPEFPINPAWLRQWNRIPPWVKGAAVGGGITGASVGLAGRKDVCE